MPGLVYKWKFGCPVIIGGITAWQAPGQRKGRNWRRGAVRAQGRVHRRPFARRFRTIVCASSALSLLAFAPAALAQEESGASAEDGDNAIIVTARRRDERLIDVPVAITAYSGDALDKAGAMDITDIGQTTPKDRKSTRLNSSH